MSRKTIMTRRRDRERRERDAFDRLRAELTQAFATPDSSYVALNASEVIARNRA
jgi:antitoxin ParD1/3/4